MSNSDTCPNCGGQIHGDGHTVARHCERINLDEHTAEPDAAPIYCPPTTETHSQPKHATNGGPRPNNRHVHPKKRFQSHATFEHLEPGQRLALFVPSRADSHAFEVLSPGGARACFARSELVFPGKPTEAHAMAYHALIGTLRPIIDLANPMDDAARRRIGARLQEINIRSMTVADLLEILTDCERIEMRKACK